MADLPTNRPFETREPVITIDQKVPLGRYTLQLVVENRRGQRSKPVLHVLTVRRRGLIPIGAPSAPPQEGEL
jgi:hypothetical protein